MIFPLLYAFFIPLCIGYFTVSLFWQEESLIPQYLWTKIFLSVGIGFGVVSCIFFFWLLNFDFAKGFGILILLEYIVCISIGILLLSKIKARKCNTYAEPSLNPKQPQKKSSLISAFFCLTLILSFLYFVSRLFLSPHGQWDAWASWNLRARFIFRDPYHWKETFSSPILKWLGTDHPLSIPLTIVRCWKYIGYETTLIPAAIAMLYTFASCGLIVSSLSILRGKTQGLLGGMILLSCSTFIFLGAAQYADVPLAFFFLATIVLLCFYDRLPDKNSGLLVLAGLTAGFSIWTKKEGWLFLIVVIAVRFIIVTLFKGWRVYCRELLFLGIGFLPILGVIFCYKVLVPVPNYLFGYQGFHSIIEKLTTPSRYFLILKAFGNEILDFGKTAGIGIIPLLISYLILVKVKIEKKDEFTIFTLCSILILVLIGYFFVYVIDPSPLQWDLDNSLSRLLCQLWPAFIFIFFFIARSPEDCI